MIKVKNDPPLLLFSGALLIVTFALVAHGDVTWKEAAAFVLGALALPGLFGKQDEEPKPAPLPADEELPTTPGTTVVASGSDIVVIHEDKP